MTDIGAVNGGVVAGTPSDNTTMSDVLRHYERAGFASSWTITADSQLRCESCHREMAPSSVAMHSLRRVEGASDPADTAAVLALTCIYCGARGTLVTMYGPLASSEESDVVTALQDRRCDDVSTPNAPPGETANGPGETANDEAT